MRRRLPVKLFAALGLAAAAVLIPWKPHRYTLHRQQLIERPIADVFAFFEDPHNLATITPREMGFEIIRVEGLSVRAGTRMEYRIHLFGVPRRWVAEIVEYEPGWRFVDVQAKARTATGATSTPSSRSTAIRS